MQAEKKTRIQARNEEKLLQCAQTVFAAHGLKGATMEKIAELADMSQPNVHRYFATKNDLYIAVIDRTLHAWFEHVASIDVNGNPKEQLRHYISRKLEMARSNPEASRLFAHEILQGAPHLESQLSSTVRAEATSFSEIIDTWVVEGKIRKVDARHLIFMIWSITQYYVDFGPEVLAVLDKGRLTKGDFASLEDSVCAMLFEGLFPER